MSSVDESTDLTSSTNDKQNALDAIPTSSTDATFFTKTESTIEDPISSTSSEVCSTKCLEDETDCLTADGISFTIMGQSKSTEQLQQTSLESEEEFLNLNMENVSTEQSSENVEDIVQDLENLLGDTYSRPNRDQKAVATINEDEELALEELEELTKKDTELPTQQQTPTVARDKVPKEAPLPEVTVSPSVEINEVSTKTPISEEPESVELPQKIESTEESESLPVVTEPNDAALPEIPTTSSVLEIEESNEIHSTIKEETEIPSPPKKPQKVKLIRSPITLVETHPQVQPEKFPETKDVSETLPVEEKTVNIESTDEQTAVDLQEDAGHFKNETQSAVEEKLEETVPIIENTMEIEESPESIQALASEEMEVEQTLQDDLTKLDSEPVVVEDQDKDEIEMKDITEDVTDEIPILIDDPVVSAEDLAPDNASMELELPPVIDDLTAIENIDTIVPADDDQLIAESSVIDELIETAALDSIVTEPILNVPSELETVDMDVDVEKEPAVEDVPNLENVVLAETAFEENIQKVTDIEEIVSKNVEEISKAEVPSTILETEEPSTILETEELSQTEGYDVVDDSQQVANEEIESVPEVEVKQLVPEKQSKPQVELEPRNTEQLNPPLVTSEEISTQVTKVESHEPESNSEPLKECPSTLDKSESSAILSHEINPSLKTTLTVDVSEQEPAGIEITKSNVKQESHNLLKITISKQADNTHSILKVCSPDDAIHVPENIEKIPKISIKSLLSPQDSSKKSHKLMSPSSVPKLTIKPIVKPDSPVKLTIKPIVKPDEIQEQQQKSSPKLTIKPIVKPDDYEQQRSSPKLTIKPIIKPDELYEQKASPKLTIKPIVKPDDEEQQTKIFEVAIQEQDDQARSSPKITIKSVIKHESDEGQKQKFSPKLTIKPIVKPEETIDVEQYQQKSSPKLTIKPIVKPDENVGQEEQKHLKLTIKPIVRPEEQMHSPKITIKPVIKPQEEMDIHSTRHNVRSVKTDQIDEDVVIEEYEKVHARSSTKIDGPKVTIKPVIKPAETTSQIGDFVIENEEEIKQERIILKINKSTLPSRKREHGDDGGEKLAKIKVKYSKEGGHAHIVPQTTMIDSVVRHPQPEIDAELRKRFKLDDLNIPQGVTITNVEAEQPREKDSYQEFPMDDVNIEPIERVDTSAFPMAQPIVDLESKDPLGDIPSFEHVATADFKAVACNPSTTIAAAAVVTVPTPRKRGRPRKVPLQVREEFKDPPKEEEPPPVVVESTRPKRSCRGPSVRATLGIKPRKPRGPGRGRGGKRAVETRATVMKAGKEPRVSIPKLKLLKETITNAFLEGTVETEVDHIKEIDIKPEIIDTTIESRDVPIYEEETRMSADAGSSRAQTPAKQVPTSIADVVVEESQSSVQSTATTESAKGRRGPRLEVHQEPEGAIISADQLAEYSWGGGGPYMLQEQVAQFLGIKSFKRKYPGIQRRPVEMQERDFIRESGLASEAMCDLGLTAVNSADILDIMYSDFQPKYEEYCKHQRDRQAKDLTNKQKALTLAVSQEKNNLTEQAVQSAAAWNLSFNKMRREKRKACMDLQTFTIHYPKGKVKQINKPPVGNYPVALVPGQFTDYYKEFTPTELNSLPLNTLCYNNINTRHEDDSQSDGSASDSDSSSSDSDSSDSGSSDGENCTMCRPSQKQIAAIH